MNYYEEADRLIQSAAGSVPATLSASDQVLEHLVLAVMAVAQETRHLVHLQTHNEGCGPSCGSAAVST